VLWSFLCQRLLSGVSGTHLQNGCLPNERSPKNPSPHTSCALISCYSPTRSSNRLPPWHGLCWCDCCWLPVSHDPFCQSRPSFHFSLPFERSVRLLPAFASLMAPHAFLCRRLTVITFILVPCVMFISKVRVGRTRVFLVALCHSTLHHCSATCCL